MTFNFSSDWPVLLILLAVGIAIGALVIWNIREHFRAAGKNKEDKPDNP